MIFDITYGVLILYLPSQGYFTADFKENKKSAWIMLSSWGQYFDGFARGTMMRRTIVRVALAAGLIAGLASGASAGPITAYSGDGGDLLVSAGTVTQITPHSSWGDVSDDAGLAPGTASWISYADTGVGGSVVPNAADRTRPNATSHFRRTFQHAGGQFSLWVLGDDTATVSLSGVGDLFTAFGGQFDPCAPGGTGTGLGCVEADMAMTSFALAAGSYTLDFYTFQTNGDVFGTQYAFSYQASEAVPEPEALAMMGLALLAIGGMALRRRIRTA